MACGVHEARPPGAHPGGERWPWAAPLLAAGLALGLTFALLGLWPWEIPGARLVGPFHDGHVWAFDQVARMLLGEERLDGVSARAGYPGPVLLRLAAWLPALLALPLRGLLGPLGAYDAVLVASPALGVLGAWALLRRAAGLSSWASAGLALAYGLCPYALGCLQSGQVEKLQIGLLPLCLLALHEVLRGRLASGLPACALGASVMAFTMPCTALFLPLAAAAWLLGELVEGPERRRLIPRGALGLGALALGLLPARLYFGDLRRAGMLLAFEPGRQVLGAPGPLPVPAPVAQPEGLLLGLGGLAGQPQDASHVVYLGLPLLLLAAALGLRRGPGRAMGWALLCVGVVTALGPLLVSGGELVAPGGRPLRLPAALLEALGYPTRESGMYYRAVLLAALGLPLLCAGGWARRRPALAAALAWAVGLGQVADGWRATRSLWPPPHGPVPGHALLRAMAADPAPGAVLDLPFEGGTWEGGNALLAAAVHGRPTTGLPRQTSRRYLPEIARLAGLFERAGASGAPEEGRRILADAGFRYLCWRPWLGEARSQAELERAFGPSVGDADLRCWMLP